MYRLPISSMARVVSQTMKATHAMKMNITFWNSPIPKSEKVKGIKAATGMLRPNKVIGMKNACIRGKQPQSTPRGTPTSAPRPNPSDSRRNVVSRLRVKARSNHRLGKLAKVSAGLESPFDGGMILSSGAPRVRNHQSARHAAMPNRPINIACQRGSSWRSASRHSPAGRGPSKAGPSGNDGALVAGDGFALDMRRSRSVSALCADDWLYRSRLRQFAFSAVRTLISTRRFLVWLSGSIGRSQPTPSTLNRLPSRSVYFLSRASLMALARLRDRSLTASTGTCPFIELSVWPSMMIRAVPN